jgi:hypothetical protein
MERHRASLFLALVVIYRNLQVERGWVCSALHDICHQVNVRNLGMLPGALENNAAAQGEAVRSLQLIPHFFDRPRRADEGGWHSGVVLEALRVLLSHGCRDPPTHRSDESAQCSQGITLFFNVTPIHFHAHIVVAASIPAMNETMSITIARPESLTPVGGIIAVASSEILHQQALYSHSKLINADFTCIDHDVVIVVVNCNIGNLLDV